MTSAQILQSAPDINSFCSALQQSLVVDNTKRQEAEQYLQSVKLIPGIVQHLLTIASDSQAQQKGTLQTSEQASIFLKHLVNQHWTISDSVSTSTPSDNKENTSLSANSPSNPDKTHESLKSSLPVLTSQDKEFVFANILSALDQAVLSDILQNSNSNNVIIASFYSIIYNLSQLDYARWNGVQRFEQLTQTTDLSPLHSQIAQRLQASGSNESVCYKMSGLKALKSVLDALEEVNDDLDRKPLYHMVTVFFPIIEQFVLSDNAVRSSPHYVEIMIQVCKIFYTANKHEPCSYVTTSGKLGPWINLFISIMDSDLGPDFETPLYDHDQIQEMNKQPNWRLKTIVAEICRRLFQKLGIQKSSREHGKALVDQFRKEFEQLYAEPLANSFVQLLMRKKTQFVANRALNSVIRMITTLLRSKLKHTKSILPYVKDILFNLSLPLLLTSQKEVILWQEDPVEYVRLQFDFTNTWNVRRPCAFLIDAICNVKVQKKQKISPYLTGFLNNIVEQLLQIQTNSQTNNGVLSDDEMRQKEALLHAFGLLNCLMAKDKNYQNNAENMLQQFVFPELRSTNPFLRARACQVYGQFSLFPLKDEHLQHLVEALFVGIQDTELPVRVNAAVSLIKLLHREVAQEIVRPALGHIIRIYIKLIDDIEYDELIKGVNDIVDIYGHEIAPYALELCRSFSESYLRLLEQIKSDTNKNGVDKEQQRDNETSLTLPGLFTALRRVLQSISGKFPELYPQLEQFLLKPIYEAIMDPDGGCMQEALTCLGELLHNQENVSDNMWNYFSLILNSIMSDGNLFEHYMDQVFAVLINYLNKASNYMKTQQFVCCGQQITYLESMCQLVCKAFEEGRQTNQFTLSVGSIALGNAILENVKEAPGAVVPGLVSAYLSEMQKGAEVPDFQIMLLQGLLMCVWYDCQSAVNALEQQAGASAHFLEQVLKHASKLKNEFEVKKFTLGLTALLQPMQLPEVYTNNYQNIMQCLVFLCKKSVEMRQEDQCIKKPKQEQAEVDNENDSNSDEEGEYDINLESEEDDSEYDVDEDSYDGDEAQACLYEQPLDSVDEVLYFAEALAALQNGAPQTQEMFTYFMSQLSPDEINSLNTATNFAQMEKQQIQKQQQ